MYLQMQQIIYLVLLKKLLKASTLLLIIPASTKILRELTEMKCHGSFQ